MYVNFHVHIIFHVDHIPIDTDDPEMETSDIGDHDPDKMCSDNYEDRHISGEKDINIYVTRFILGLYKKGSNTRTQIQDVVEGVASLFLQSLDLIYKECEKFIKGWFHHIEKLILYRYTIHVSGSE